jgi:4-hydroxybutyrate CoA-transferase
VAFFAGGPTRVPCFFSEVPLLFETHYPVDVAMVTVSPPDVNGNCSSLGVSVDYTEKAVETARVVIAEVN